MSDDDEKLKQSPVQNNILLSPNKWANKNPVYETNFIFIDPLSIACGLHIMKVMAHAGSLHPVTKTHLSLILLAGLMRHITFPDASLVVETDFFPLLWVLEGGRSRGII